MLHVIFPPPPLHLLFVLVSCVTNGSNLKKKKRKKEIPVLMFCMCVRCCAFQNALGMGAALVWGGGGHRQVVVGH